MAIFARRLPSTPSPVWVETGHPQRLALEFALGRERPADQVDLGGAPAAAHDRSEPFYDIRSLDKITLW